MVGFSSISKYNLKVLFKDAGVRSDQIGIITPYASQRELLVANLQEEYPDLEIQSVDGFQGREKEAVIISLVRSNGCEDLGFIG